MPASCSSPFGVLHQAPADLLQSGHPYSDFLRFLAEHGYYGKGDGEEMVAKRAESLRNPSNKTFEDRTPDGRTYRIHRRPVKGGGRRGTPKIYTKVADSGAERWQAFCPDCGTQIYAPAVMIEPKVYGIRVGTVRQRHQLAPKRQYWCQSALPWVENIGSLPGFERE